MTTVHVEEPNAIDLARLDDDGGSPAKSVHTLVIPDSPTTMREGSAWKRLGLTLRRFLIGR